jgi:hypothetical protein
MVGASQATLRPEEARSMAQTINVFGIDVATLVCHVVGMHDAEHIVFQKH